MDTSFYRAPRRSDGEVRHQRSIALSSEETAAVHALRLRWEEETGVRITFADAVRACIYCVYCAQEEGRATAAMSPPAESAIRTVRLTECRSCGESFPAEHLSKDLNCAACWRAFYNLTDVPGQEASKGKGAKHAK